MSSLLKRKLEVEMSENKILKLSDSIVFPEKMYIDTNQRNLNFKLKDQTARKNLLAAARRDDFEKEDKQKCTKLKFSAGAYYEVVLPTVRGWKNLSGKCFNFEGKNIKVSDFKAGYEENNKHFDSKIVFLVNGNKTVVHSYNSTQNMKVEGKGYIDFIQDFLEPYFKQVLSNLNSKIDKCNRRIIHDLGKPQVRRSMRYKPVSEFRCKTCASNFITHKQLVQHKVDVHADSFNSTRSRNITQSSSDDSVIEQLMLEDMSISNISTIEKTSLQELDDSEQNNRGKVPEKADEIVIEKEEIKDDMVENEERKITPEKHDHVETVTIENTTCIVCGEDFEDNDILNAHKDNVHRKQNKKPTPSYFKCEKCQFTSKTKIGLERHVEYFCSKCSVCLAEKMEVEIHSSLHNECIARSCDFASSGTPNLRDHVVSKHPKEKFPCTKCDNVLKSEEELLSHFNNTHRNANKEKAAKSIQTQTDEVQHSCDQCDYSHKDMAVVMKHIFDIHCLPAQEYKCNECEFSAEDETYLKLHKINTHNAGESMSEKNMIQTFCNFIGRMIHDSNEVITKMVSENSENVYKLMKNQEKIEKCIGNVEAEIKEIKVEKSKTEEQVLLTNVKVDSESACEPQPDVSIHKDSNRMNVKHVKRNHKKKVAWIGTSISKVLDKEKFEKDLNVELSVTRAYCIKEEDDAENKKENFEAVVPEEIRKEKPDILILQTGNIEITNIEVNKALIDNDISIEEYKRSWFEKVEQDSKHLFEIAQNALKIDKNLQKVVILKRLPRQDRSSADFFGIKSELSNYANAIYDQLWIKMGSPKNIIILELELEGSKFYQNLIYGSPSSQNYDGVHLNGEGAVRQFTYQTIKQLKLKLFGIYQTKLKPSKRTQPQLVLDNDHTNCPQALYKRRNYKSYTYQSQSPHTRPQSYADVVRRNRGYHQYSASYPVDIDVRKPAYKPKVLVDTFRLPLKNRFAGLSEDIMGNY